MQDAQIMHAPLSPAAEHGWVIRYEWIAYIVLGLLALAAYGSALGVTPLTEAEARAALAAWRFVSPDAPGAALLAPSPIVFLAQTLSFAVFGSMEPAARALTALAGVLVVLSPVLFRRVLGIGRALLLSTLLLGSPVLLIAARSSSPAVWSLLLAVLTLWSIWRWWDSRTFGHAATALTAFLSLLLLTDPGGVIMGITLLAALGFAWYATQPDPDEVDEPRTSITDLLRAFPWGAALPAAGLIVIVIATLFLFNPGGLAAVGDVLARFITGTPALPDSRLGAFPLLVSLFYEPWYWVLGAAALIYALRRARGGFVEYFALAWLASGMALALWYPGAGSEQALWMTGPLVILISSLARPLFGEYLRDDAPGWARWVVAVSALALLAMSSLAFQAVSRSLARGIELPTLLTQLDPINTIVLLIAIAFAVVGYFLVRSFWFSDAIPLRGAGLALLTYAVITSIGSGWSTSVSQAGNPFDLWQRRAVDESNLLLRASLMELASRWSLGYPEMDVTVVSHGSPLIEWAVRDFSRAAFVQNVSAARGAPVVLMAVGEDGLRIPDLGGPYVGQGFVLMRMWDPRQLALVEIPRWWSQHPDTGAADRTLEAILWVRQDVYNETAADRAR